MNAKITIFVGLAAASLLGSCYNVNLDGKGKFLCADRPDCPSGYTCSAQKICVKVGAPTADLGRDALVTPDAAMDAPPPDAGSDQGAQPTCTISKAAEVGPTDPPGAFGFSRDPSTGVLVVSTTYLGSLYRTSRIRGGRWSKPVQVTTDVLHRSAVSIIGKNAVIAYRNKTGGLDVAILSASKTIPIDPMPGDHIAIGGNGSTATVVYQFNGTSNAMRLNAVSLNRKTGNQIGMKTLIDPGRGRFSGYGVSPVLASDATSGNHLAFIARLATGGTDVRKSATAGSGWAPSTVIGKQGTVDPRAQGLAMVILNKAPVFLYPVKVNRTVLKVQYPNKSELLTIAGNLVENAGAPTMAVAPGGTLGIAFVDYKTGKAFLTAKLGSKVGGWLPLIEVPGTGLAQRADQLAAIASDKGTFELVYRIKTGNTQTSRVFHRTITCTGI